MLIIARYFTIRLGEEMVLRKQAEDKVNQLQKKLDFNDQLHKEQMKDAAGKPHWRSSHYAVHARA